MKAAPAPDWGRRRDSLVSSSYYTTDEFSDDQGDYDGYGYESGREPMQSAGTGYGGAPHPYHSSAQSSSTEAFYNDGRSSTSRHSAPGYMHQSQAGACSWAAESVYGPASAVPSNMPVPQWPVQISSTVARTIDEDYMKKLAAISISADISPPIPQARAPQPPPRPPPRQQQRQQDLHFQLNSRTETHLHLHFVILFFTFFHPTLPIVDERNFLAALLSPSEQARTGSPSLALLNAVCSIGVLYSARRDALAPLGGRHRASADFARASHAALHPSGDLVARCLLDVRKFGCALENEDNDWELFASAWRLAQKMQLCNSKKVETLFAVINGTGRETTSPELVTYAERKRVWWGLFTLDTFVSLSTGYDVSIDEALYMSSLLDSESFEVAVTHPLAGEKREVELRYANSRRSVVQQRIPDRSSDPALPNMYPQQVYQGQPSRPAANEASWGLILGGYPEDSIFGPGSQTPTGTAPSGLNPPPDPLSHLYTPLSKTHPHVRISIFLRKVMRLLGCPLLPTQIVSLHAKTVQLIPSFPAGIQRYLNLGNAASLTATDAAPPVSTICVHTLLMFFATLSLIHQSATADVVTTHAIGGHAGAAYMTSLQICGAVYRLASKLIQDVYTSRPTPVPRPPHELVSSPFAATLLSAIAVSLLATPKARELVSQTSEGGTALPALEEAVLPALEDMAAVWPRAASYARQLRGWMQVVKMRPADVVGSGNIKSNVDFDL
ncbi:hypothetical protein HDU86_000740 [Geranomyces michiganensis]|nr:hypothetical protein HDU86_000740 [Geranomyces michiganensis]